MNFLNKNKIKITKVIFLIIVFLVAVLRLYLIFTKNLFSDEVLYWSAALNNSFFSLIKTNHWLNDHGLLFLIILKGLQFISKNIIILRMFNLLFYFLNCGAIFYFFSWLGTGFFSLIPVFLYSFYSYFVYNNILISPFNLVMTFSLWTFFLICKSFLSREFTNNYKQLTLVVLPILLALVFFSDYTSAYTYLFIGIFTVFLLIKKDKRIYYWIISLLISLVLILPGVFQLGNNFSSISKMNQGKIMPSEIFIYTKHFADTVIFREDGIFSSIFLILVMGTLLFIKNNEKKATIYLSKIIFFNLFFGWVFMAIFSVTNFFIFIERTFWFFYFNLIFGMSLILFHFRKQVKFFIFLNFFLVGIVVIRLIAVPTFYIPGIVPNKDIHYLELVNKIKKTNNKKTIILVDNEIEFVPLIDYYFTRDKWFADKNIVHVKSMVKTPIKEKEIVVFFDWSDKPIKTEKTGIIYRSRCYKNECFFIEDD